MTEQFLFQSTLPVKGATYWRSSKSAVCKFQSTLPVKGATAPPTAMTSFRFVSIHAPGEGSDSWTRRRSFLQRCFNPRSR